MRILAAGAASLPLPSTAAPPGVPKVLRRDLARLELAFGVDEAVMLELFEDAVEDRSEGKGELEID